MHTQDKIISKQFANFFNSYTQAFNKENKRHGSLLESPFRRKLINDEKSLVNLILYIHLNPISHKICNNVNDYRYSSYPIILSNEKTELKREKVIDMFGTKQNFVDCH